jgi:jumonji domain-containing protein 7
MSDATPLLRVLIAHAETVRSMWAGDRVPRLHHSRLTSLDFLRDYVGPSRPLVLEGAADHWRAMQDWQGDGLETSPAAENLVTLSFTPTGRADALAVHADGTTVFAKPEDRTLPLREAIATLRGALPACGIAYLSAQNDSLRAQTPALVAAVKDVRVGTAALASGDTGGAPRGGATDAPHCIGLHAADAVNLWVGTSASTTSTHKDAYENLYTVVRGRKTFTLFPPSDVAWLYEQSFPAATWVHDSCACGGGGEGTVGIPACWTLQYDPPEETDGPLPSVPWISVDPASPDLDAHPLYVHASPLTVTLGPGDTLFLPSLWYHHVATEGDSLSVAVNSWFNMSFLGGGWASYQLVAALARAAAGQ